MTRSGVIGAALIVFVFSLGFFVTPAILGGGRSIMAAELVYLRMFQSPDWGLGAAISVALVVIVGAAAGGLYRLRQAGAARGRAMKLRPEPIAVALAGSGGGVPADAAAGGRADLVHAGALPHDAERRLFADPLPRSPRQSRIGRRASCSACEVGVASSVIATALALLLRARHLDVPAALRRPAGRLRAAADGGAAGRLGDDALFPADQPLRPQRARSATTPGSASSSPMS